MSTGWILYGVIGMAASICGLSILYKEKRQLPTIHITPGSVDEHSPWYGEYSNHALEIDNFYREEKTAPFAGNHNDGSDCLNINAHQRIDEIVNGNWACLLPNVSSSHTK